jgi:uncharacterized membrane protein YgcG
MSAGEVIVTVETDPKAAVVHGGSIIGAGMVGAAAGFVAGPVVATTVGLGTQAGMLATGVVVFVLVEALFYVGNRRGPVTFYRDRVAFHGDTLAYDDVSAAVRQGSFSQGLFGTTDYELLAHGEENLDLRYVADPAEVERVLDDRIPDPRDQMAEAPEVHDEERRQRPRYLVDRWAFWHYWEKEEGSLPAAPVVTDDELGDVLDVSVSDADLDELDDVDMDSADGLGDVDAGDVGADVGDADGGFDGGGFDGGGGGGGE